MVILVQDGPTYDANPSRGNSTVISNHKIVWDLFSALTEIQGVLKNASGKVGKNNSVASTVLQQP